MGEPWTSERLSTGRGGHSTTRSTIRASTYRRKYVLLFFLREMAERKRSFWGWTTEEWIDSIDARLAARQHAVAIAYGGFSELGEIAGVGMIIAYLGSITLLPALLSLLKPPGEPEPVGFSVGANRFLY